MLIVRNNTLNLLSLFVYIVINRLIYVLLSTLKIKH